MEVDFVDMSDLSLVKEAIKENTKLIWIESPTNPLLKVTDIAALSEVSREAGALLSVDNTFMSPYFSNPLTHGADLVFHSGTKYIAGHSDLIMGFVCTNDTEVFDKLNFYTYSTGPVPGPMDCYLALRSIKTLAIRMEAIQKNAQALAIFLEEQTDVVSRVYYTGLESHPQYELAKKQQTGHAGIISFILKDGTSDDSRKFLQSLKVFLLAESLGGVESLAECPALMTHASIPADHRAKIGIVDGLVRLAVGIENVEDLKADLTQALKAVKS